VDVEPSQRGAEAEYVIDLCRRKTGAMRAAVIGGHPASADFAAYIKRHAESGFVRGVRQVLQSDSTPNGTWLTDDFVKGIRLLGKLGLSFDLCMRPAELSDGAKLADRAPDTRFVLDHCGNADARAFLLKAAQDKPSHDASAWKRDMEALARRSNVICKISGIVAGAPEKWSPDHLTPIVDHCLDTFGPDRVVFGGDWPVCLKRARLMEWIDALKQITSKRPQSERNKLWFVNAKKFYGVGE
jgi:predicted TIM-barrel fold metal-dependent hydrolase